MAAPILYWTYVLVMVAGALCFVQAYRFRKQTARHKRYGIAGVALALSGITVVIALTYLFGWRVEQRWPDVVLVHRRVAYVSTTLLVLVAVTGMRRHRFHPLLARISVVFYFLALALAVVGYRP